MTDITRNVDFFELAKNNIRVIAQQLGECYLTDCEGQNRFFALVKRTVKRSELAWVI